MLIYIITITSFFVSEKSTRLLNILKSLYLINEEIINAIEVRNIEINPNKRLNIRGEI